MTGLEYAAEKAYRCLLRLNTDRLPIRPEAILQLCRGTALYTYQEAMQVLGMTSDAFERQFGGGEGFTWRVELSDGTTRYLVCYRADGNRARLRFTLAHELGHIVLHHRGASPGEETEADCFAAHLLCPRPFLRKMQLAGMDASALAAAFYVSDGVIQRLMRESPIAVDPELEKQVEKLFDR